MSGKQLEDLVADVYHMLEEKEFGDDVNLEEICEDFGKECAAVLREQLEPDIGRAGRLRLSAVGKPDRQIWNAFNGTDQEKLRGPTYIKFLYGHIIEAMILALVKAAGHSVTDQQKVCHVEGIKGHMDCRIDGVLVDVKSCSSYGYKKFKNHTLHEDDPFGYIGQIKAYAKSEGDTTYGWLAFDKQNGSLCTLVYDEANPDTHYYEAVNYDIAERVAHIKKLVSSSMPDSHCYAPVLEKNGNQRLASGCAYCPFKHSCYPELKTFVYATGPKYLVHVEKQPRVLEIPEGF